MALHPLCWTILTLWFPPCMMFVERKFGQDFIISLVLYFLFYIGSPIYTFHKLKGLDICVSICCLLLPPLGVYLHQKKISSEFWITLLCFFLFWWPGAICAYYFCTGNRADSFKS